MKLEGGAGRHLVALTREGEVVADVPVEERTFGDRRLHRSECRLGHLAIDVTPARLEDDQQLLLALVVGKEADHGRRHDWTTPEMWIGLPAMRTGGGDDFGWAHGRSK